VFGKTHVFLLIFNLSLFWYLNKHAFKKFLENSKNNSRTFWIYLWIPHMFFSTIVLNIRPRTYNIRNESSIKYIPVFSLKLKKKAPSLQKKNTKNMFCFQFKFYLFYVLTSKSRIFIFTNARIGNTFGIH
jgi:hypothetical protein